MMPTPQLSTQLFTLLAVLVAMLFTYAFVMGVSHWHERKRHVHR